MEIFLTNWLFFILWFLPLILVISVLYYEHKKNIVVNGKIELTASFAVNSMLVYSLSTITFHQGLSIYGHLSLIFVLISFAILKSSKIFLVPIGIVGFLLVVTLINQEIETLVNFLTIIYWLLGLTGIFALLAEKLDQSHLEVHKKLCVLFMSVLFFGSIFHTSDELKYLINSGMSKKNTLSKTSR